MSSFRFTCQCCHQPLQLSSATETLGLDATQALAIPGSASAQGQPGETRGEGQASREETDIAKQQVGASCGPLPEEGPAPVGSPNTFTLLGELASRGSLSSIQKAAGDIFDILTGATEVDHPLCEECTDGLLEHLDSQLALTESEIQNYRRSLETRELAGESEKEMLQEELAGLELEEARLLQELQELEKSWQRASGALEAARAETRALARLEQQHRLARGALAWEQLEALDELGSVDHRLRHAQAQLRRLQEGSVFSAAFAIWQEGPLGIINDFRLGRLPAVPVSWGEINAAWGQAALLLSALSNKIGLGFRRYRLAPRGDHSYLRALASGAAELPLFCHGGQSVFLDNGFDRAMVAFLDCMQQFQEEAGRGGSGPCLPYRVNVEKGLMEVPGRGRGFYSIRTHLNTEEQWTKALRLMLVNLKGSLAWVSLRYCQK